jgi:hypothetical protein
MKKAPPSYGYQEVDYRLAEILLEAHDAYLRAVQQRDELSETHGNDLVKLQQLFTARNEALKHGVIAIVTAVGYLEASIYRYATHFFHYDSFDSNLGSLSLVSKWIVVPRLCQNIHIAEDSTEINDLRELVRARNCIIHSKIKWMTPPNPLDTKTKKEHDRFSKAASKSRSTTDNLLILLETKGKRTS